jgi:Mn2+/Fe2+ NRAMP family transporter
MKKSGCIEKLIQYKDTFLGSVMLLIFVNMFVQSESVRMLAVGVDIGPRFFPKLVAVLGWILSVLIIVNDIPRSRKKVTQDDARVSGETTEAGSSMRGTFIALALVIGYMLILDSAGFILASGIYLFLQALLLSSDKQRKNKKSLLIILCLAIIIPVAVFFAFRYGFYLMLPTGSLF